MASAASTAPTSIRVALASSTIARVHPATRFGEGGARHLAGFGLRGLQQLGEAPRTVLLDQFEQGGGALFEVHRGGSGIESELGADPLGGIEPARRPAGVRQHHDERVARRQCRLEFVARDALRDVSRDENRLDAACERRPQRVRLVAARRPAAHAGQPGIRPRPRPRRHRRTPSSATHASRFRIRIWMITP